MTGHAIIMGTCFGCKQLFTFNGDHVPSIWIDPETQLPPDMGGNPDRCQRQPLCRDCVTQGNAVRVRNGKEPIRVHPLAYEPMEGGI